MSVLPHLGQKAALELTWWLQTLQVTSLGIVLLRDHVKSWISIFPETLQEYLLFYILIFICQ